MTFVKKKKFVIVGVWNTFFGYGVYVCFNTIFSAIFLKTYSAYLLALLVSNVIAVINAFVFHKYITFNSKATGMTLLTEFARFSSIYIFTTAVGFITLPFLVEIVGIDPTTSGLVLIPVVTVVSYVGHSQFSFRG